MMPTGKASGNAVLAKARALYGSRLRADDYRRLMACRTMTELAAALKEYPRSTPSTPAASSWKTCCARACTPGTTAFAAMTAARAAKCMSISPSAVRSMS